MNIEALIKRNQRLMLFRRQCRDALRSSRGRIYNGRVDVTQATIGMLTQYVRDLLKANAVLRAQLRG